MQRATIEISVFLLLVAAGATSRVLFRELPNFAPIAAMALFAGYFFRRSSVAMLVPLSAMLISDCFLGFYEWPLMAVVYAMLTLPVALRPLARRFLTIERGQVSRTAASLAGLLTCSLGSSLLFFAATNFAVWCGSTWYPQSWQGLLACYGAAIPFLKYTLLGDLCYACLLFGGYAAAVNLNWLTSAEGERAAVDIRAS
ncbi:MAG TPA: DUF6580 family putative transport protein [Pirellulaceae bacterium]|nr:DUF6580 family putative transport protein [Pirellulaceae bacterium]